MGDRVQDRGLGHLGAPGRLGVGGSLRHPFALDRDVDQAPERLGQPLDRARIPGRVAGQIQPRVARARLQRNRDLALRGRRDGLEHDTGPAGGGRERDAIADALELRADALAGEDRRGDLGHELGLALTVGGEPRPALSLGGALAGDRGQPPDDDRRDQQHDQLDQVLRVGDRQAVARDDEEEVEREHAQDRGHERGHLPAPDRDQQHREQVQAPEPGGVGRRGPESGNAGGGGADDDQDLRSGGRAASESIAVGRPGLVRGVGPRGMQPEGTEQGAPISHDS